MGRPSEIKIAASKAKGQVNQVKVTGRCVQVMEGVLDLVDGLNMNKVSGGCHCGNITVDLTAALGTLSRESVIVIFGASTAQRRSAPRSL